MRKKMSIEDRRKMICELLQTGKILRIDYLSAVLGNSSMTIRRDLEFLQERGLIQRVHGGAALARAEATEPPYTIREREMQLEKQRIGLAAAGMVGEREVIFIDIGSTPLWLVRSLPLEKDITVVTHWLPVVAELGRRAPAKVIFLGGQVSFGELCVTGGYTKEMLQNFVADKLFLGVAGVSPQYGLTDYHAEETQVKREMIRCAKKVIVLADHSKFGRVAPLKIADLGAVHQIVTDAGIPDADRRAVESLGVEVVLAGEPGGQRAPVAAAEAAPAADGSAGASETTRRPPGSRSIPLG
jgi:DeoR/GlpR family transcriptional regulator of sugar metabolism